MSRHQIVSRLYMMFNVMTKSVTKETRAVWWTTGTDRSLFASLDIQTRREIRRLHHNLDMERSDASTVT